MRARSFLTLCDAAGDHRIVVEGGEVPPKVGDHVSVSGDLHRPEPDAPVEIQARTLVVNAHAAVPRGRDETAQWIERRGRLLSRAHVLHCLREALTEAGFHETLTPLLSGAEAAMGASHPFAIALEQNGAWLPVNHIGTSIAYQAVTPRCRYAFGKLFWQHPYNNRFSLSEINSLDLSAPALTRDEMMNLIDRLILAAGQAIGAETSPPVRLSFEQAASIAGVTSDKHALPVGAAQAISAQLGCDRFWITAAPASASPYYTAIDSASARPRARSFELWIAGVPNIVAGSEWAHREVDLNSHAGPALVSRQRAAIVAGLGPGTGATIGLDRLAMALCGASTVREMLLEPRTPASFRDALAANALPAPDWVSTHSAADVAAADDEGGAAAEILSRLGAASFAEVQPSAIATAGDGEIAWYGRRAGLAAGAMASLVEHVGAGLDRVMACAVRAEGGKLRRYVEAVAVAADASQRRLARKQFEACAESADCRAEITDLESAGLPLVHAAIAIRGDAANQSAWRCGVCGFRCATRPAFCPVCMAPAAAFVRASEPATDI